MKEETVFQVDPHKAQVFLKEIIDVCKKHNISIGHIDAQGQFELYPYNERFTKWLLDASFTSTKYVLD